MNIKGIGVDIVEISRFENKEQTIDRFLNQPEKEILSELNEIESSLFIAGRFASKEAIIKASNKELLYEDVSIIKGDNGEPQVILHNESFTDKIHITISHEKEYAMAFCIIEKV